MSEPASSHSDDSFPPLETGAPTSAGNLLRVAREAQGLSITALAVALKVSDKKLEALEADRFDSLPDIVFVRALAASLCRALKIEPGPILLKLPNTTAAHLNSKGPIMSVPFRAPGDRLGASFRDQLSKPLTFVVLVLLLGALVLVFAPVPQLVQLAGSSFPDVVVEKTQIAPISPATATTSLLVDPSSSDADTATTRKSLQVGNDRASIALDLAPPILASNLLDPSESTVPKNTVDLVVFKARGSSWVEVIDATASVKLRKTLANGDVVSASGVAPLSVVVGRADVVDVQWRERPVDLTSVVRENVARFEVK